MFNIKQKYRKKVYFTNDLMETEDSPIFHQSTFYFRQKNSKVVLREQSLSFEHSTSRQVLFIEEIFG